MRLDIARRVASGRKVHRPWTSQIARSEARPRQYIEYGRTGLGATTKAADNGNDSEVTDNDSGSVAAEISRSPVLDVQPRASANSTLREWFRDRLWQVIQRRASKEVYDALKELLKTWGSSNISRERLGLRPLQEVLTVLRDCQTSLHVVRLLHAFQQWQSHRTDLTARQERRLRFNSNRWYSVRLALDSNQVQPDRTADSIFLFRHGFAEILKGKEPESNSLESDLNGSYCIEVLAHLINDINTQLAEDIKRVVPERGYVYLEDRTKIHGDHTKTPEDRTNTPAIAKSSHLPLEDYGNILARLPLPLQRRIQNGLLYDPPRFRSAVTVEHREFEVWDDLASLIEHELSRPKKRSENRHRYITGRASLLANIDWIRHQNTSRPQKESKAKLEMMRRWREYHDSRLRVYERSTIRSIGTRRRIMQLKATIKGISRAIKHHRSAEADTQSTPEREIIMSGSSAQDSFQETLVIAASIQAEPASLPDSMLFHLSRELLDSLNEAAYAFGQQNAPAMMRKGGWTGPEKIDLPVFISSFYLSPNLVGQIVGYQGVFGRLREFRNHTAHGGGNLTTGDVLLVLDDFIAAAKFFRSPELAEEFQQYRKLLSDFTATQTQHTRRAFNLIKPFKAKLRAELENKTPGSKNEEQDLDRARAQSMASEAAMIKEAWTHTEQNLSQLNSRNIAHVLGKAQIRRIMETIGPDTSAVLIELLKEQFLKEQVLKEQSGGPDKASVSTGVEEILSSLRRKLSQVGAQHVPVPLTEANNTATNSVNGQGLTSALHYVIPSYREASSAGQAWQQKEQLDRLAKRMRKER